MTLAKMHTSAIVMAYLPDDMIKIGIILTRMIPPAKPARPEIIGAS
jgi:hypothetical protein